MFKLTYFLLFLAVTSLLSCEKKVATPIAKHITPNNTDTNSGKIFIVAGYGNGTQGFSGDGGPATIAELAKPCGVAVDENGNIYISDAENGRIRKVTTNGVISTFAGINYEGFSGDGGPATIAELQGPAGLAFDIKGNLYFSDQGNNRVRKVSASGIITTIAGDGIYGDTGDGGPATSAELALPYGITLDSKGNLYIAHGGKVRLVNTNGIISTFAGTTVRGYSGDGGPATLAELGLPQGVAIDKYGNVLIADYGTNCVRIVNSTGIILPFAGNGFDAGGIGNFSGDGGPATVAELSQPADVKVDAFGNVYIADDDNYRVRVVNSSGIISTYVGKGYGIPENGVLATETGLTSPYSLYFDGSGNLYICDLFSNEVLKVYK